MNNQKVMCQVAIRRRVNSSSAVQNLALPRKMVIILDDTWLEALKHVTWPQWSLMSLVSRQVNLVIQRNLSRLPPPVIDRAIMESFNFWFGHKFGHADVCMARSLQLLFHPIVYFKRVTFFCTDQKLKDVISNTEGRYIRCHSLILKICGDIPQKLPNITALSESLKWLEKSVRSDSISFPEWISCKVHKTVRARALLSDFIFGASQKCKVQELIFTRCHYKVEFLNNLIEDFLALPIIVQDAIPTVVIGYYPQQVRYRAHLGENLIRREVRSEGAHALYVIENGEKRIQISFCHGYSGYTANVKFYTI